MWPGPRGCTCGCSGRRPAGPAQRAEVAALWASRCAATAGEREEGEAGAGACAAATSGGGSDGIACSGGDPRRGGGEGGRAGFSALTPPDLRRAPGAEAGATRGGGGAGAGGTGRREGERQEKRRAARLRRAPCWTGLP